MSYTAQLIIDILQNYLSIAEGSPLRGRSLDPVIQGGKASSVSELTGIWKADIDKAISALAPSRDVWKYLSEYPSRQRFERELADERSALSRKQRIVLGYYIVQHPQYVGDIIFRVEAENAVSQMKRWLRLQPVICANCGTVFKTFRKDRRTCSDRCRVARSRGNHADGAAPCQPAPPVTFSTSER